MSRKRNLLTPAKACECCGRIVVYLRQVDRGDGIVRWVICYAKGWDGNPWYMLRAHKRHPRRGRVFDVQKAIEEQDFFTL